MRGTVNVTLFHNSLFCSSAFYRPAVIDVLGVLRFPLATKRSLHGNGDLTKMAFIHVQSEMIRLITGIIADAIREFQFGSGTKIHITKNRISVQHDGPSLSVEAGMKTQAEKVSKLTDTLNSVQIVCDWARSH